MPIYEFECDSCRVVQEKFFKLGEIDRVICLDCCCDGKAYRVMSRPAQVAPCWPEYMDHNLGDEPVLVKGRGHRKQLMKERGLEEKYTPPEKRKEVKQKLEHIKHERSLNK